jgi:hypothetical protein
VLGDSKPRILSEVTPKGRPIGFSSKKIEYHCYKFSYDNKTGDRLNVVGKTAVIVFVIRRKAVVRARESCSWLAIESLRQTREHLDDSIVTGPQFAIDLFAQIL